MNTNTRIGFIAFIVVIIVIAFAIAQSHMPVQVLQPITTSTSTGQVVSLGQPTSTENYACTGGKTIAAAYYAGATTAPVSAGQPPVPGGHVVVNLSDGRTMTLAQSISADGVRYANPDESFVFWNKGNGVLVLENNEQKSYIGCIEVAPQPAGTNLPQAYVNSAQGFSLRLPSGYTPDELYNYQALGPGKDIKGVKFTIPASLATGTNLSNDSYVSVEQIPNSASCSAKPFVESGTKITTVTDNGVTYSFASTSDAAAGNRYEETVYAISGTNPCIAVRYFIHYGAFENYPAGSTKQFDQKALLKQFDDIRRTLVVNQ